MVNKLILKRYPYVQVTVTNVKSESTCDVQSHSLRESVGPCPFRGSFLKEFELSHINLARGHR